jgi:multimeric flavodoxin WrbA
VPKLLIIYHSQSGNTEALAKAVAEGAGSAGAIVTLKKAADATAEDLLDCDVAAFGTPNYYSDMAGALKDFFDREYWAVRDNVHDKPYGAFCSSGINSSRPLESVERVASRSSLGMKQACDGIIVTGTPSSDGLAKCRELGTKLAQL